MWRQSENVRTCSRPQHGVPCSITQERGCRQRAEGFWPNVLLDVGEGEGVNTVEVSSCYCSIRTQETQGDVPVTLPLLRCGLAIQWWNMISSNPIREKYMRHLLALGPVWKTLTQAELLARLRGRQHRRCGGGGGGGGGGSINCGKDNRSWTASENEYFLMCEHM